MRKDLENLGISGYKMALFRNDGDRTPRPECIEKGIPEYVHIVFDSKCFKERTSCFGIRLPEEKVREDLLILKTIYRSSIPNPHDLADEVIQLMIDDKPSALNLTMGESLVQACDAAVGMLTGNLLPEEIFEEHPLGSL